MHVSTSPQTAHEVEGRVSRILRIGFESRIDVLTEDGELVTATMTRTMARSLGVSEGTPVWLSVSPGATTVVSAATAQR
ncbi:MAG TPA: TOBE-like domain-containing protein [Marmoricola sp.]|nr:TOBE-like domain-containing protein [Marmoricola sp.]